MTKSISLPKELWEAVEEDLSHYPDLNLSKLVQNLLRDKLGQEEVTFRRRPTPKPPVNLGPASDAAKVARRAERKLSSSSR